MGHLVYQEGKVEKILISGDNSTMRYNEVIPARQYLIDNGIPEQNIFVDYAGFNTYDTMYRAKNIFKINSAVVVTQSFHLPRAVLLASVLGIDVQGIPATTYQTTFRNNIREVVARVKATRDIIANRNPQFLDEEIPITSDGRATILID